MFNKLRRHFEAKKIIPSLLAFAAMVLLNNAGSRGEPFSAALLFSALLCGGSPLSFGAAFIVSFLIDFSFLRFLSAVACAGVLCAIYGTFGKKINIGIASAIFLALSLLPYVFLSEKPYAPRAIAAAITTAAGAIFYPGVRAIKNKTFGAPEIYEAVSLSVLYFFVALGGIKYAGYEIYKAAAVLLLAVAAISLGGREVFLISAVLALPAGVYAGEVKAMAPFLAFGAISAIFSQANGFLYAAFLFGADLAFAYLTDLYPSRTYFGIIYFSVALAIFVAVPRGVFQKLSRLFIPAEKPLKRYEINRTRTLVSGQLYEISGTFREIAELFGKISEADDPLIYENAVANEVDELCAGCSYRAKCRASDFPPREDLLRLVGIAKGKGRLTAVDLPKSFTRKCGQAGKIVFTINKYVAEYGAEMERKKVAEETRRLVALQAEGVAATLKSTAKKLSKALSFRKDAERKLRVFLAKKGVFADEVLLYGEGEETEIHLSFSGEKDEEKMLPALNDFFRERFAIAERYDLLSGREILIFERACPNDCVFGVAAIKKNGEDASGDTHTLIKLGRSRFLLALSDGMGSGEKARTTSSTTLSLIECFYRAGLPGKVALGTVNNLLAFSGEDNFAALDVGFINLDTLACDFIKLGAPYGFILSQGAVKLVEGSSLPMGILSELKPAVCCETVSPGDVIIFMSDGITDAFGSSTDFADFLSAADAANPQKLADSIMARALALQGDKPSDDMTVIACKIFAV